MDLPKVTQIISDKIEFICFSVQSIFEDPGELLIQNSLKMKRLKQKNSAQVGSQWASIFVPGSCYMSDTVGTLCMSYLSEPQEQLYEAKAIIATILQKRKKRVRKVT